MKINNSRFIILNKTFKEIKLKKKQKQKQYVSTQIRTIRLFVNCAHEWQRNLSFREFVFIFALYTIQRKLFSEPNIYIYIYSGI